MLSFLRGLFDTSGFPARWSCGRWTAAQGWLHIVSDLAIWSAYVAIPCVLIYYVYRRRKLPYKSIFILFGAFILACGTTHLMDAIIFWWPAYRLAGVLKLFTALVSWATVLALAQVAPKAFALRSPEALQREVDERMRMEERVRQRTLELSQTADELRQNERRYRSLVEATTAIVWNTAASGEVETDLIGWAAFTGQTQEQIRGIGWLQAVHEEDRARVGEIWTRAVASKQIYETDYRLRTASGEYRHMLVRGVPVLEEDGNVREWVGTCTDITDRTRAEAALKQAKEAAEGANRAKSEFLANVSHEIRTPMNAILGMTELTLASALTAEQRENLGMVKTSAQALLQLINNILDFSKIEGRKLELDPIPFPLREALGATVNSLSVCASQKGLALSFKIDEQVPDAVIGDLLRLRQVVTNLVGNAIKFTEQGEVAVSVKKLSDETPVDGRSRFTTLQFSVLDTGIGIPEEKQHIIFEEFTQADASTTRRFGGTGLGLSIASQLVALMGGRIWVESKVGSGSTFHFTIRLETPAGDIGKPVHAPVEIEQPSIAAQPSTRALRILLAEDNQVNQVLVLRILRDQGHTVTIAGDGRQALALAEQAAFDLILMDIQMPLMDGLAVTAAIREREKLTGAHIPIIAQTARALGGDRARCMAAGMDAYLSKPLVARELFDAIARLIPTAPASSAPTSSALSTSEFAQEDGELLFDPSRLLRNQSLDNNLLLEIIELFLDQTQNLMPQLRSAVEQRDGASVERAAHKLRGSLSHFAPGRASQAARRLEIMGRQREFGDAAEAFVSLERQMEQLWQELNLFLAKLKEAVKP